MIGGFGNMTGIFFKLSNFFNVFNGILQLFDLGKRNRVSKHSRLSALGHKT